MLTVYRLLELHLVCDECITDMLSISFKNPKSEDEVHTLPLASTFHEGNSRARALPYSLG